MDEARLSGTLGYLLGRVCRAHYSRARTLLDDLGLYRGQQFVLCVLWKEEGITHSELAERLHVHPTTVTNAIKRMERAGFVERRADPEDKRVSRVYLTEAGREIQDAVERTWAELEKRTLQGFSAEERDTMRGFLERIHENLTDLGETR